MGVGVGLACLLKTHTSTTKTMTSLCLNTAHIFFDDAMTLDDDEEFVPNEYVKMLVEVMEEAVR